MWKRFLKLIGVVPKKIDNRKTIQEQNEYYNEILKDKEVIVEFKNSSIMSIIKPKGVKLIIKNYDIHSLNTKTKNKLPSNLKGWKFIRTTLNADIEI